MHEIRNARINAGELGSGTALTTTTLYRLMYNEPIPQANASLLSNEDALVKLITDKSVDVVAIIAGQPRSCSSTWSPRRESSSSCSSSIPNQPSSQAALKTYVAATVRPTVIRTCCRKTFPPLAVKAYLVTFDFSLKWTEDYSAAVRAIAVPEFPELTEKGHPKWREVDLVLPDLGRGWLYYPPSSGNCAPAWPPKPSRKPRRQERARSRSRSWVCANSA